MLELSVLLELLLLPLVDHMLARVQHLLPLAGRAPEASLGALAAAHELAELAHREVAGAVGIERAPQRLEPRLVRVRVRIRVRVRVAAHLDLSLTLSSSPTLSRCAR